MKTIPLLLLCSVIAARSATFDLGWVESVSPGVTNYWVWIGATNVESRLLSVGKTNAASVSLPDGSHRVTMTAANMLGESVKSLPLFISILGTNVVVVTGVPLPPTGLNLR